MALPHISSYELQVPTNSACLMAPKWLVCAYVLGDCFLIRGLYTYSFVRTIRQHDYYYYCLCSLLIRTADVVSAWAEWVSVTASVSCCVSVGRVGHCDSECALLCQCGQSGSL